MADNPFVGARISYLDYIGTVRYIGPVDGTSGTWLGVEWDDPARGKHDGIKDGKRYFECLVPYSGSFIRPNANVKCGKPFLEALKSRYIEDYRGSNEVVVLGSSQGTIQVEAVNLDKVRAKLSNLASLREVSLDGQLVARNDLPPGIIKATCPNITGLDLSRSLICSWDIITAIANELPFLKRLYLNHNRFQGPIITHHSSTCFNSLSETRMNDTLLDWNDVQKIIATMPKLQEIEIGYNRLTGSSFDPDHSQKSDIPLRSINLDSNRISQWTHVCSALSKFPWYDPANLTEMPDRLMSRLWHSSLERLILANNQIDTVPSPRLTGQNLPRLKLLSLAHNSLSVWDDISNLGSFCPSLESLSIIANPLVNENTRNVRALVIGRLGSLKVLDGTIISAKERRDAELYYLSCIASDKFSSEDERLKAHPRWLDLQAIYGTSEVTAVQPVQDTLRNRLFGRSSQQLTDTACSFVMVELKVYQISNQPSPDEISTLSNLNPIGVRVLPTMTLKSLRIKIRKTLGYGPRKSLVIFLAMEDGTCIPLESDRDSHDLSWIGLENGSQLLCYV